MAASGISGRLFGSAVRGAQDGKGGRVRAKPGVSTRVVAASPKESMHSSASSAGAGVRGRGPRTFGGGASMLGGTSEALNGGSAGGLLGRGGDHYAGNPRASAFARAFDVEESAWKPLGPVRRGRGRRAGPYEPFEEMDADYNGVPRYFQRDWDEPDWEHDHFEGPQTVGSAIFVRNLPPGLEGHHLRPLFEEAGQIANVQVDNGPLPTATIGYVRQAVAFDAAELFNGRYLLGHELKVTVKKSESVGSGSADDDFWRQELRTMKQQGRLTRNDPWLMSQFVDDWEDPWGGYSSGWKGKGKGGRKGQSKGESRRGGRGDIEAGGGMRSALAWDS